jgi:death on curing protein
VQEPRWLPRLVLDAAHFDQLREHGGRPGLRDEGAQEAALARARHKRTYEKKPDLATLAAAYGFGLATTHPYVDGNKRAAFLAMAIFLGLNGLELDATEPEVVVVMLALASGTLKERELAEWLRRHLVPFAESDSVA